MIDMQSTAFKYLNSVRHSGNFIKVEHIRFKSNKNRLSVKETLLIRDEKPSLDDKKSAIKPHLFI